MGPEPFVLFFNANLSRESLFQTSHGLDMDLPAVDCKFPGNYKSLLVSGGKSWFAGWNIPKNSKEAQPRFWPVWVRLGVRVRVRDRDWVGSTCVP